MESDIGILVRLATDSLAKEAEYIDEKVAGMYGNNYNYAHIDDCERTLKHLSVIFEKDHIIGYSATAILRIIKHYQDNGQ